MAKRYRWSMAPATSAPESPSSFRRLTLSTARRRMELLGLEPPTSSPRAPGWDACAAVACGSAAADPVCSALLGVVRVPVVVAILSPCVCGVHVADLVRRAGGAGLTSPSAR